MQKKLHNNQLKTEINCFLSLELFRVRPDSGVKTSSSIIKQLSFMLINFDWSNATLSQFR